MKDPTNARARLPLACALLVFSTGLVAQDATANRPITGKDRGDESYEIEQRERWFIETRGLSQVREVSERREMAMRQMSVARLGRLAADQAAGEVWTQVGPASMKMGNWSMGRVSGRLNAIAPDPSNEDIVYVGTAAGGLWKTTNGGGSWTPVLDSVGNYSVGAIAIETATPKNVWVGTGDRSDCSGYLSHGVYLTTDGGNSWTARNGSGNSALGVKQVSAVAVVANNSNVILAGGGATCNGTTGSSGLYRSTDRGVTWTRTLSNKIEDIVTVPNSATVFASAPGSGVFKSTDGGATWNSPTTSISGSRLKLAISGSDPNTLYAFNGSSLYHTGNGGTSWTVANSSACDGQCSYNLALAVHPTTPSTVVTAAIRPYRSTNSGSSQTVMTNQWGTSQQVHQDTHVAVYSRTNGNRLWIGSDGGLWRTDNGGSSWVNMNSNLAITLFYDIAVHPTNPDIIFGGAQDNSSSGRLDGSNVWDLTFAGGDGFMNLVDEVNPNIVFQTSYPQGSYPSISRSTQGGSAGTFNSAPTSGLSGGGFAWKTILATAGGYAYVGGNYVFRMPANGSSWTAISGNIGSISAISAKKIGNAVPAYAGNSSGAVWFNSNSATNTSFTNVTGNLPSGRIGDIAMDPTNAQRVFVARSAFGGAKVYRSTSGGSTWTAAGGGLPDVPANAIKVDPKNTQRIFVGTDVGVYASNDGGSNFVPFSAGMPVGIVINDLEIDDSPHVLTAGTYGRGAWKAPLGDTGGDNKLPTAGFSFAAQGRTVTFTDSSTDTDGRIVQRNWNFGDGSNSGDTNPVKVYTADGSYNVTLTVTDDKGGVDTETQTVVVAATPGNVLVNNKPVTDLSGKAGDERFWTMEVPAGANALKFTLAGGTGDADLYVKYGSAPTSSSYDCRSYSIDTNEMCDMSNVRAGTYHVMVRGFRDYSGVTLLGSHSSTSGSQTYTNETDVTIVDKSTVESAIKVSGRSGNANATSKIAVGIIHTYIGDLKVELIAPDGTAYLLHNRSGGSTDNIDTTYSVDLSSTPLNGEWKLRVYDGASGDTGKIDRWSITF